MMNRTPPRPPTLVVCALIGLFSVFPNVMHAANECQIKYAYAPSMGQSLTVTVNLDAGQTKTINRSNVLYVQNVKSYKIKVYRSGFGTFVELAQNGRDPGAGNYLGNVVLQKVTCATSSGSGSTTPPPSYQTPAAMITALKAANTSVSALATQVVATFNVGGQQMAELLKAAGYDANQVAQGLAAAFNANAIQAMQWLKAAGFTTAQVITAAKTHFNATVTAVLSVQVCGAAGCPSQQLALALKNTFNTSAQQLATLMKGAGYSATQITEGLQAAFSVSGQQAASLLRAAQYDATQVAAALSTVFSAATGGQVAQWLKQSGFSAAQTAQAVHGQFNASALQVAQWLRLSGFAALDVAAAVKARFNLGAQQAAQVMQQAGYSLNEVATMLKAVHGQSAAQAAALLQSTFGATNQLIQQALQAAGYAASEIAAALTPPMSIGVVVVLNNTYGTSSVNGSVVPMYAFTVPIAYSVIGEGLLSVTSVTGLPAGATYTINGQQPTRLVLNVHVPQNARVGIRGIATLVGAGTSATFPWVVTAMPTPTTTTPGTRTGTGTGSTLPDLVPATFVNNLYKVGSATTMDVGGNTYTALNPHANSPFCQGIPDGATGANNMPTANRRDITVPDVRWGVQNSSTVDVTTAFNVKLYRGSTLLASQRVPSLARGQVVTFEYRRPQSTTTVARVGPGSGCYHVGLASQGWNDNAGFQVRVDTENEVQESSTSNNIRNMN